LKKKQSKKAAHDRHKSILGQEMNKPNIKRASDQDVLAGFQRLSRRRRFNFSATCSGKKRKIWEGIRAKGHEDCDLHNFTLGEAFELVRKTRDLKKQKGRKRWGGARTRGSIAHPLIMTLSLGKKK